MKRTNINPMSKKEFEVYVPKIVEALGDDIIDFFHIYNITPRTFNSVCSELLTTDGVWIGDWIY